MLCYVVNVSINNSLAFALSREAFTYSSLLIITVVPEPVRTSWLYVSALPWLGFLVSRYYLPFDLIMPFWLCVLSIDGKKHLEPLHLGKRVEGPGCFSGVLHNQYGLLPSSAGLLQVYGGTTLFKYFGCEWLYIYIYSWLKTLNSCQEIRGLDLMSVVARSCFEELWRK